MSKWLVVAGQGHTFCILHAPPRTMSAPFPPKRVPLTGDARRIAADVPWIQGLIVIYRSISKLA
jgi:hypothetical protein